MHTPQWKEGRDLRFNLPKPPKGAFCWHLEAICKSSFQYSLRNMSRIQFGKDPGFPPSAPAFSRYPLSFFYAIFFHSNKFHVILISFHKINLRIRSWYDLKSLKASNCSNSAFMYHICSSQVLSYLEFATINEIHSSRRMQSKGYYLCLRGMIWLLWEIRAF